MGVNWGGDEGDFLQKPHLHDPQDCPFWSSKWAV